MEITRRVYRYNDSWLAWSQYTHSDMYNVVDLTLLPGLMLTITHDALCISAYPALPIDGTTYCEYREFEPHG